MGRSDGPGLGRVGAAVWAGGRRWVVEGWRLGRQVELLERSMAFAALCFVTLVPLLVVIAAASPVHGDGVADWITDALGLSSRAARPVRELFVSRRQVLTTTTGFGLAALAVFGVSLMASMQRAMERIWHLRPAPWHAAWRQVLGLAGLVGYILVAAWSGRPWPHAVQPSLRICATVLGGLALFWWLPRLLLFRRVRWRALLPGTVATMAALAGLRVFSQLVFAPLIVSNALSYGAVGTVLVVQSWLVGVGFTVYAGAVVGRVVGPGPQRVGPERSDFERRGSEQQGPRQRGPGRGGSEQHGAERGEPPGPEQP